MAISKVQDIGTNAGASFDTTTAVSFSGATKPAVGDLVVVHGARDNIDSDPLDDTLTDSNGNTYSRVTAFVDGGGAQLGIVAARFHCVLTSAWSAGTNTVTWTHPSNRRRVMSVEHYTKGSSEFISIGSSWTDTDSTSSCSITTASVASGSLVAGTFAAEYGTSRVVSYDSDTTNGSWVGSASVTVASGGTAGANVYAARQRKITTGAGAQTWDISETAAANVDCAAVVVEYTVTAGSNVTAVAAGVVAVTASAVGSRSVSAVSTGSLSASASAVGLVVVPAAASGALSASSAVMGHRTVVGQAAAQVTVVGHSAGIPEIRGSATSAVDAAGVAVGLRAVNAVAAGSLAVAGSAAGLRSVVGAATAELAVTASALGVAEGQVQGQAVAVLTLAGAAVGTRVVPASAAATVDAAVQAVGLVVRLGAASGAVSVVAAATGVAVGPVTGLASGLVEVSAGASGTVIRLASTAPAVAVVGVAVGLRTVLAHAQSALFVAGDVSGGAVEAASVSRRVVVAIVQRSTVRVAVGGQKETVVAAQGPGRIRVRIND